MGLVAAASAAWANVPAKPTASLGRTAAAPSVFGSAAISVGSTALDAKWRSVSSHLQAPVAWAAQRELLADMDGLQRLQAANTWVNHQVRFAGDHQVHGVADHWSSPAETANSARGDCEDFALAKMALLRAAGVAEADLYLTIVRDTVLRADHAVLLVRLDGAFYVLDSQTDQVMASTTIADYRPIITLAAAGAWVHGFLQKTPTIQLAAGGR
jgi:predicted transglutaminase-like cysteine proteinase